jgi:small subunit ribosomal protein S1
MIPFSTNPNHPVDADHTPRTGRARDEEIAFLRALLANPDDDTTRLVYADWLDEHGDHDCAEFIRLGHALRDPSRQKESRAVHLRRRELRSRVDIRWQILIGEQMVGQYVPGIVTCLTDQWAHVDLGGLEGTISCVDFFWHGRGWTRPAEIYRVGQRIEVFIVALNFRDGHVALAPDRGIPGWDEIAARYTIGSRHTGEVVNVLSYGVFVKLEQGIEGLAHKNELSKQQSLGHPRDRFEIGEPIEVKVLSIDWGKRRISLG